MKGKPFSFSTAYFDNPVAGCPARPPLAAARSKNAAKKLDKKILYAKYWYIK
jgi:hypothetical protein